MHKYICEVVSIITPKKFQLDGLWFGGDKTTTGFIYLHGLTGSAFQLHDVLVPLTNESTTALYLNNRGHNFIGKVKKIDNRSKKGFKSMALGVAHETFTDCVDDIQGVVNLLKRRGVNNIYLVGHSTGCQKSIYYLSRPGKQKLIKGVVLLCPLSDYAYTKKFEDPAKLKRAVEYAERLIKEDKSHELMPTDIWPELLDAQRFLSLNTQNSIEEIFTYSQPSKRPITLQKVKTPILMVLAGKDEFADRPARKIESWFKANSKSQTLTTAIVSGSLHGLMGHENKVAELIHNWKQTIV